MALYGKHGKYWAMTERRKTSLQRSAGSLAIGPSAMSWDGKGLTIDIAEFAIPRFSSIRGKIRLNPPAVTDCEISLDAGRRHQWTPIAPRARIEVEMRQPALSWKGSGYFDSNTGGAPLEDDFKSWTWSRMDTGDGAAILYDVIRRDGSPLSVAIQFDQSGRHEYFAAPGMAHLPRTGWRIDRQTRSENGANIKATLEDTPFYARSVVSSALFGKPRLAMHESLSLDRFRSRWVQTLLPFRMPRAFS